ncbi:NAD(P)-binding protein [Stipitochalara longipes BDJ]|nr:NAD(P)-binding protein [Stipitochalara longipes BDJ]
MSTKAIASSTILITGATGLLGSTLVKTITGIYPGRFKLLLTCRNVEDIYARALSDILKLKSADFSLEKLDLSDLQSVKGFANSVKSRISKGELPGFGGGGVVNCAAILDFSPDAEIQQKMYFTNTLGPTLLMRELLPSLIAGGDVIYVNVGSSGHSRGTLDHFHKKEQLNALKGGSGYASSKLLLLMTTYVFQRKVYALDPQTKLKFMTLDPGVMNGQSRLNGPDPDLFFRILIPTLAFFGPVLRRVKKAAINIPEVPAEAIAGVFEQQRWANEAAWERGKNFVLDDEVKSSALSLDEEKQDEVWENVMKDLELPNEL